MKTQSRSYPCIVSLLLVIALLLFGCGSDTQLAEGGGQSGTGMTSGTISAFGSIFVNGIEFDTQQAEVFVDGQSVGSGDAIVLEHLAVGQLVRVLGADDLNGSGATAAKIYYEKTLEGPISHMQVLDPYTWQVTIMGQEVIADDNTRWSGMEAYALALDMIIELSGHLNSDGTFQATYIARKEEAVDFTVKGRVRDLNRSTETLRIHHLTVDFSAIAESVPQLTDGTLIWVVGSLTAVDTLVASQLVLWHPIGPPDDTAQPAFITGVVNQSVSAQNFYVDHYPVTTDDQTIFGGIEADQIANGMGVTVTGTLQDGVILADRVELYAHFELLQGEVQHIDLDNQTIVLAQAPLTTIRVNSETEISGRVDTLEALAVDDWVVVRGWQRPDESISAVDLYVFPGSSRHW